ncbi:proline--tRNA ligase [Halobacteriales archaeon QS_1_68_20]|nr:MAG: proline--tRNA ligase [Halobacteriales archaeon QS_1_68_20]
MPASREPRASAADAAASLERAGLIRQAGSGLHAFAPAGERVKRKLIRRLRTAMAAVGGQAVSLPALQDARRWRESGRWRDFEDEMFTLENRDGRAMCLAPSHEEAVVDLLSGAVRSYDDLPLLVYQVGEKYRDDHARNGLVRCKAFTMKDAYSVHADAESLALTYREVRAAYARAFADLGVEFAVVGADDGVMGGSTSEEFVAPVADGSDRLRYCTADGCRFGVTDERADFEDFAAGGDCPDCGGDLAESDGIEIAHVFQLDTRYSEPTGFTVDAADGTEFHPDMGSYGVGVTRLLQVLVQQDLEGGATDDGLRWPVTDWSTVAPYRAGVVPVRYEGELRRAAEDLYDACEDVLLFDDRSQSVGERFAESDLLGLPAKVVLGDHYLETGEAELETRDGETTYLDPGEVPGALERYAAGT